MGNEMEVDQQTGILQGEAMFMLCAKRQKMAAKVFYTCHMLTKEIFYYKIKKEINYKKVFQI